MSTLTAFIIGLVVGWIVEWVIDWLYWRRQRATLAHDLDEANAQVRRLRSDNKDLDGHYATQRQEVNRLQAEVASLKAEKEAFQAQAAKPAAVEPLVPPVETARIETIETQSQAAKPVMVEPVVLPVQTARAEMVETQSQPSAAAPIERDDLEVINGIGPVIARKLNEAGIYTFSDLGRLTAIELRQKVGDIISRLADEDFILQQARQLAEQKNQKG